MKEGDNRGGQRGELGFTCSGALEAFEQTLGREDIAIILWRNAGGSEQGCGHADDEMDLTLGIF